MSQIPILKLDVVKGRYLIINLLILWFLKVNLGFRCNVCTSAYLVQFLTMVPKLSPPPLWIESNHFQSTVFNFLQN